MKTIIILITLLTTITAHASNEGKEYLSVCRGITGQGEYNEIVGNVEGRDMLADCIEQAVANEMAMAQKQLVGNMVEKCNLLKPLDRMMCAEAVFAAEKRQMRMPENMYEEEMNILMGISSKKNILCSQGDDLQRIGAVSEATRDALKAVTIKKQTRKLSSVRQK